MNQSNVHPISAAQPAPSCRFSIQAVIGGFPVQLEGETTNASNLVSLIEKLRAVGAEPPAAQASTPEPTKAAGVPTCPIHGSKMKEGRRGFYCPRKVGDDYCKEVG